MQFLKDNIEENILNAAQKVFLRKNFQKASMREIADEAHVGVSNIYNYFESKDCIFYKLVKPLIDTLEQMLYKNHSGKNKDFLNKNSDIYLSCIVDEYLSLIQNYRSLLTLLFFHAQGSSLENYKEEFTKQSITVVKKYFLHIKQQYPNMNINVSDFSIRLHTAWMFTLFEELIKQRNKPKDVRQIITEYITFEFTGWRELMKI
ncbi:MAG: TetR/AcrR family transcriptional regulator [Bacteroides sp.]|jgi:AcrR family transcriptional regulator|nr:TetR/AcrR family transcriptional regulator [Bacteroides sp.]